MGIKKLIRFDFAMKYMLRDKANFDVLEGFLTNLLKEEIKIEELLESESNQESDSHKFNRVDLKCKNSKGEHLIIEIQNQREIDYLQRILWGTSKAVVESVELGQPFKKAIKVISISILYHELHKEDSQNMDFIYYGTTELFGMHTKQPLVLHEAIVRGQKAFKVTSKEVFPEYYMIYVEKFNDMIKDALDEWIYFFKHGAIKEEFTSPGILLAAKKLDYISMKKEDRLAYESYLTYLSQETSILETAKEEGIALGKQEGKKEKSIEIAKNLLDVLEDEMIAQKTGLTAEEVKNLRNNLGKEE